MPNEIITEKQVTIDINFKEIKDKMKLATVSKSARPPFLILTPICLFLGWSVVISSNKQLDITLMLLSFLGAILAHISVNTLNEYLDFKSGLDLNTIKTQFSGGSGALPESPHMAKTVFAAGVTSLVMTLLIGIFFIWHYGWKIAPLGIVGVLLIIFYTDWINRQPLICLIAPGTGFGLLMVEGAYFSLTGEYSPSLWVISLVPFFLINNLLLLNQYPDLEADKAIGRNHFPIAYGIKASNKIYGLFMLLTALVISITTFTSILPKLSLIALLPLLLGCFSLFGAIKYKEALGEHPKFLAANVVTALLTPALLAISIIYG